MKKKLLCVAGVLCVLVILADLILANFLVSFALIAEGKSGENVAPKPTTEKAVQEQIGENSLKIVKEKEAWLEECQNDDRMEEVSIVSDDGLKLVGDIFINEKKSHKWLVAIHGYTGQRIHMYDYAVMYAKRGYNVLTPDMRSHGESEGKYIGMGWLDRKDVLKWIDLIIERDPKAEIVMHGVSMGGATVMMTSGVELPENVVATVDDCGYTSVWDIFSDEAKYLFHIPDFPILYTASPISKLRAGYSFKEASALEQIKKTKLPVLFIHGSEDNFVHTEMGKQLYEVCPTRKDIYIAEGAGHGQSYYLDPEVYEKKVFKFLAE